MDWQPIETAPKDGTEILIAGGVFDVRWDTNIPFSGVSIAYWDRYEWRGNEASGHDEYYSHRPTHWMPLPAPPKEPQA